MTVWLHGPSGKYLAAGSACASERFAFSSEHERDVAHLKVKAESRRERERILAGATRFLRANAPDLEEVLLTPEHSHPVLSDMAHRLLRFGSLSEKQIAFARRLVEEAAQRERNPGGKTDWEVARAKERESAEDAPIGRVEIEGEVIKISSHISGQYGETLKMTVKDRRGFLVWLTVPASLQLFDDEKAGFQRELRRGDRVRLTASLTRSKDDPKFAFGKRPSKASLIGGAR